MKTGQTLASTFEISKPRVDERIAIECADLLRRQIRDTAAAVGSVFVEANESMCEIGPSRSSRVRMRALVRRRVRARCYGRQRRPLARNKKPLVDADLQRLEEIKKLVVIAMFSDDDLMNCLVLKGGNALDLIHRISTRASRDVDFSMQGDFLAETLAVVGGKIENALRITMRGAGLEVFDFKMEEVPEGLTADMAGFWGGYGVEFKLIDRGKYTKYSADIETLRKNALQLGWGDSPKFTIDISRYEYTIGKEPWDLDNYRIFVYSAGMIVAEKLRAICQQMTEYGPIVKRKRAGGARARDFLDIYTLVAEREVDMSSETNFTLLKHIFDAKRVPLSLLQLVPNYLSRSARHLLHSKILRLRPGCVSGIFFRRERIAAVA